MKIGFIRVIGQFAVNLRNQHILEFLKKHHDVYEHKIDGGKFAVPSEFYCFREILRPDFFFAALKKAYHGSKVSFSREVSIKNFIKNAKVVMEEEYNKILPLTNSLDMLHAEDIFSGYVCYMIKQKKGIPYVFDLHNIYYEAFRAYRDHPLKIRFYDEMESKVIHSASSVVCVSDLAKIRLRELYALPKEKIYVVKNGTLLPKEKTSYSKPFKVIFGGNLVDAERVMDFIEARSYFPDEEVEFYLMGDGPHREKYLDFINKKGLNIIYLGLKPWEKAMKIFGQMQTGVIPGSDHFALRASSPMKVIDYASCGLPIIIPELYDFSKYVKKYNAGILIEKSSPEKIAEGIKTLMDRDLWQELSLNARSMAEKEFLWVKVLSPLDEIYKS